MKHQRNRSVKTCGTPYPRPFLSLVLLLTMVVSILVATTLASSGFSLAKADALEVRALLDRNQPAELHYVFIPLSLKPFPSALPAIYEFSATPGMVRAGDSATLSWSTGRSVESLTLEPGIGDVTRQTSIVVAPMQTTTYTLSAHNSVGTSASQAVVVVGDPPSILRFMAIPDFAHLDEEVTLLWRVENSVDSLTLEPGIGDVAGQTSVIVFPTETTTYTLTAANGAGAATEQIVVTIWPPSITGFAASPDTISLGESATLSWGLSSPVDSLILDPGFGDVAGQTSVIVSPTETTVYTLTARSSAGTSTAQTALIVEGAPEITEFVAVPDSIALGGNTTLSWSIDNQVDSLTLEPGIGDVTGQSGVILSPTQTTTYTLTAHNDAGAASAQVAVTVRQPPIINSFTAEPSMVMYGDELLLSWSISNTVDSLTLEPGVGDVTGQTEATVTPPGTTTYVLTAGNDAGVATAQVLVTVDISELDTELLVFDWNKAVTVGDKGFAWDRPPRPSANGDWTQPIDFTDGRLMFRAEVRSQPVAQDMKLQFCFWQYDNALENCGGKRAVSGMPGTVVTWMTNMEGMYMKGGNPIDWANPRDKNGVSIKNSDGDPVSDYNGWNWYGENPEEWYPLDMRFTVVVVAKDARFSGWENYINP
mgnify:CR=1 FL=1